MYRIKKVRALELAKTMGLIHLIFGLIQGAVLLIAKSFPQLAFLQSPELASLTLQQILLYSVVAYTVGGFVLGLIIGFAFNYVSRYTGGVSVSLEKDKK